MESSHHTYSSLDQEESYVVSNKSEALNWTVWEQVKLNVIQDTSKNAVITNILVGSLFILVGVLVVSVLVQKLIYIPIGGEPKDIENLVNRIANGALTDIPLVNDKNVGEYRSTLVIAKKLKRMINDINASATNLV
ncbi:hypothetical protein [Vibrio metoecus]|uniref:hypothetical protein n=1 Tax=Vibrio metoecus TaxID=1481663 RepID=UPI00215CAFEF|nr:hypothetical protein [Vibrio metoecus]MCR9388760.1 hypothetical protein [Vibrio metoecus]